MFLRWITGFPISLALMPAQFLTEYNSLYDIDYAALRKSRKENGVVISNHVIDSTRQAKIDFCEVMSDVPRKIPLKDQKIIIHGMGASDFYENHLSEYAHLAKKHPHYRVVGFNFRGVMASKGRAWSEEDWINDTIAVVKYYRKQGVPWRNILLHGHSMGGAILTMAAAKIYQENKEKAQKRNSKNTIVKCVGLINNRSFANLTDEIIISFLQRKESAILTGIVYGALLGIALNISLLLSMFIVTSMLLATLSVSEKLTQGLLRPWLEVALWLTFGKMNAVSAYKKLPDEVVDYVVVKNDGIIKDKAGLHHALKPLNKIKKSRFKTMLENAKGNKFIQTARDALLNLKDSKLHLEEEPERGFRAHVAPLSQLSTYHRYRTQHTNDKLPRQLSGEKVLENKLRRLLKAK
ncbi:MAG: hypothetical protein BGO43_01825 [Gammaproteobacteria bacterium 39-13]|nr:alpha/beta fold hydrolase [Gammaproteobacteria bacterium]OJV91820.1 MAG: hypothetical protein BGO43_01825 [Gammaproteobacteria bacterium 39-13]